MISATIGSAQIGEKRRRRCVSGSAKCSGEVVGCRLTIFHFPPGTLRTSRENEGGCGEQRKDGGGECGVEAGRGQPRTAMWPPTRDGSLSQPPKPSYFF